MSVRHIIDELPSLPSAVTTAAITPRLPAQSLRACRRLQHVNSTPSVSTDCPVQSHRTGSLDCETRDAWYRMVVGHDRDFITTMDSDEAGRPPKQQRRSDEWERAAAEVPLVHPRVSFRTLPNLPSEQVDALSVGATGDARGHRYLLPSSPPFKPSIFCRLRYMFITYCGSVSYTHLTLPTILLV